MRISDWSSDVCSSDLQRALVAARRRGHGTHLHGFGHGTLPIEEGAFFRRGGAMDQAELDVAAQQAATVTFQSGADRRRQSADAGEHRDAARSEEQKYEIQSLMSISYAVFC